MPRSEKNNALCIFGMLGMLYLEKAEVPLWVILTCLPFPDVLHFCTDTCIAYVARQLVPRLVISVLQHWSR